MSDWMPMAHGRVKVEAAPPFVKLRLEGSQMAGFSVLAEAVLAVELVLPSELTTVMLKLRDSHDCSSMDRGWLGYSFRARDDAERFEHALLSALAHAGKWRRG